MIALAAILVLAVCGTATAQLSPGELSRPHADLEGVRGCTNCHEFGSRETRGKCLECHVLLAERIDAGKGLHARPDHADCRSCHSEHNGRDYELIAWPGSREAFDHGLTGHALEGRHATLRCEQCHRPEYIVAASRMRVRGKDLTRTRLGLSADCLACHRDIHDGRFGAECLTCHDRNAWRPAPGFNHGRTRFALEGRHRQAGCDACHRREPDAEPVYAGLPFAACTDCHRDVHDGRLGATCTECHSTSGWRTAAAQGRFDHDRTPYPLRGGHAPLACDECHRPGLPRSPLAHVACADCHTAAHPGTGGLASFTVCERCHTVEGYVPSTFTIERHARTGFPLHGGHLATPCTACHRAASGGVPLSLPHGGCGDCHVDPHGGTGAVPRDGDDPAPEVARCVACHVESGWRGADFDHAATGFVLAGRHETIACRACHRPREEGPALPFDGLLAACTACHADVHRDQFARTGSGGAADADGTTDCGRCHTPIDWLAERFDHDRDATFSLDGGHRGVACDRCHVERTDAGGVYVSYRPLSADCASCHDGNRPDTREEKR